MNTAFSLTASEGPADQPLTAQTVTVQAMSAALEAARAYEGETAPNPPVGCALLDKDGRIISVAAHRRAGQPHAEALALEEARAAGLADHIHTLVVTLEPCSHWGRTLPCTDAILATPAKAVVIGTADPNPHVKGGGANALRAAGLAVSFINPASDPALAHALKRLIAPFSKQVTTGLPWVTVKQALNRAGNMVPCAGQKTFTSKSSLILAHQLRRRADAIITGSGTILADDPLFTVRHVEDIAGKRRKLVLFDRRRRVSDAYVDAARQRGFDTVFATGLEPALRALAGEGVIEVLVEAGAQLTESVLSSPFWDEHLRIIEGAAANAEDQIEIRRNGNSAAEPEAGERHVHWNC